MSVAMQKSLAFTFCTPDGEHGIAVQKRGGGVKSLSIGLETGNRPRIGLETWGDNSGTGDIKVDDKAGTLLSDVREEWERMRQEEIRDVKREDNNIAAPKIFANGNQPDERRYVRRRPDQLRYNLLGGAIKRV